MYLESYITIILYQYKNEYNMRKLNSIVNKNSSFSKIFISKNFIAIIKIERYN
jgi:hypothetical protein